MSKDLLIPGHDGPSFGDLGSQTNDSFQADFQKVGGFLVRLQAGEMILPSESAQVIPILGRTLDYPDTCGEVLGLLLDPHCVPVLEDVLSQTSHPGLDAATCADLLSIAAEPDQEQQVGQLGRLVIEKLQHTPAPIDPDDQGMPYGGSRVALLPSPGNRDASSRTGENAEHLIQKLGDGGPVPTADELVRLANEGDTEGLTQRVGQMSPAQLDAIVNDGGEAAQRILVELAKSDDGYYSNYAATVLHEQGSDVVPLLRRYADESPHVREILHGIIGGETPIQAAPPMIDIATPPSEVADLIAELADPNPRHQASAMRKLHEMGDAPIPDLMRAKGDPATSERASQLLRWHFTGEAPSNADPSESHWLAGIASESRMSDLVKTDPVSPPVHAPAPLLDVENLTELLSRPEKCMDTLGSLIRIGAPAKAALCEILLRAS